MKYFLISSGLVIGAASLFIIGTYWSSGFLMLTMCPGTLVAIWFNGYAAQKSGIRITMGNPNSSKKATRQRNNTGAEYS